MICKKCGLNVNTGESFCRNCGNKIEWHNTNIGMYQSQNNTSQGMHQPQNNASQGMYQSQNNTSPGMYQPQNNASPRMYQPQNNTSQGMYQPQNQLLNNAREDEYLVETYIGKNAHKIISGKFSLSAFLFGLPYYIYRKMWGLLLISIIITVISVIILPSLTSIIALVEGIIFAKNFNTWYLNHVDRQVAKIQNKNPGASLEQLSEICKKKGGTSILSVIIYYAIIIGLISFVALSANNLTKEDPKPTRIRYRELRLELLDEFYELDYDVSLFPPKMTSSYLYPTTKKDYCKLNVNYRGDMSHQEYIETNINSNNNFTTKTINGNTWYYINDINQDGKVYHYIAEVFENVYHIEFIILKDSGKCSKNHEKMLQTLEIEND